MPLPSKWPGQCKDCGTPHKVNDIIDQNKNGNWCKNGDNCQGSQQVQGSPAPQVKEPTVKELRERFDALSEGSQVTDRFRIIEDYIETREACESLGITHPATIGMIFNNRVRDRQ